MARRPKRNKPNATGRNETSRFARLDHRIMHSNAYRALSSNARSLLLELISMENDQNNGSLYLGVRDAAYRMGVADLTAASRAFDELQDLGFIEMTQDAHFHVKTADTSRARCWRLTWRPGPGRKAPTWDFMEREPPPNSRERKRMERGLRVLKVFRRARDQGRLPVLDSDTPSSFRPEMPAAPVLDSNTSNVQNVGFQPIGCVRDSATHIAATMGSGARSCPLGWWQSDWSRAAGNLAFALTLANRASKPLCLALSDGQ